MITKIKGTQDFIDLTLYNFVLTQARKLFSIHNFQEIITPILEPLELFQRTIGVQTDVISKEMFVIQPHGEQDNLEQICLRPEFTAGIIRAFVENNIAHQTPLPWKVFSIGPVFRYERPQKGRFRQFHQINVEAIGAENISADVLLLVMLNQFFSASCHLDNYALQINFLGDADDRIKYRQLLVEFLAQTAAQICQTCRERTSKNPLRIFDCKNPACQQIYTQAPLLIDHLSTTSQIEWQALQTQLGLLSISYVVNPKLVRGLDYYDKTVFEFVSNDLGAQNAFCGGGHYHQLATAVGSKIDYPAIGAGIGLERLLLLLEPQKNLLPLPTKAALSIIIPVTAAQNVSALLLATELHHKQICADILLESGSLKSLMRQANKMGAHYVLLLGPEEQKTHSVVLKNMQIGTEIIVKQTQVAELLK